MAWVYYNEFDKNAAAWLRELIKENLIAPGEVDERSIEDVLPSDLKGFIQCHFFAGIGGWSAALRLAGWPDARPAWTGSCPCQPFSSAGKGEGFADERHLWPAWHHLISQCRPGVIFGEQVESAIRHGWLDLVQDDLEGLGYAVGTIGLPAPSVGAAHIRQRLWFVAEPKGITGLRKSREVCGETERQRRTDLHIPPSAGGVSGKLADSNRAGSQPRGRHNSPPRHGDTVTSTSIPGELADADFDETNPAVTGQRGTGARMPTCELADSGSTGLQRRLGAECPDQCAAGPNNLALYLPCTDGKYRPVEPAPVGLADGVSDSLGLMRDAGTGEAFFHPLVEKGKTTQRVMRLKGYGNAIHPGVAAEFIRAYMETGK